MGHCAPVECRNRDNTGRRWRRLPWLRGDGDRNRVAPRLGSGRSRCAIASSRRPRSRDGRRSGGDRRADRVPSAGRRRRRRHDHRRVLRGVTRAGSTDGHQIVLDDPRSVPGLRRLTDAVHAEGAAAARADRARGAGREPAGTKHPASPRRACSARSPCAGPARDDRADLATITRQFARRARRSSTAGSTRSRSISATATCSARS